MTDEYQVGFHVSLTVEQMATTIGRQDAELKRLREAVEVTDRWRKRKGHNDDHDCDLCNAIRKAKEVG